MKKFTALLLAALLLVSALSLSGCGSEGGGEETAAGTNQREAYMANRRAFLTSDLYAEAKAYAEDTLNTLLPGCEYEVSLEPGDLLEAEFGDFADFSANEATRRAFFARTKLSFRVNYWDFDVDPWELCDQLMARQISGEMLANQTGGDAYILDAETGKATYYKQPGV